MVIENIEALSGTIAALSNHMVATNGTITGLSNEIVAANGTITGLSNEIVATNGTITGLSNQIADLSANLSTVSKDVGQLKWNTNYQQWNCWQDMADTDRTLLSHLRSKIFSELNLSEATVTCWLTGKHTKVKVSHILPDSCKSHIMQKLRLPNDFKNNIEIEPWNFLILDSNIESAFDSLQISFIPQNIMEPTVFHLRIWDDNVRSISVGVGDTNDEARDIARYGKVLDTIGDYDGFPLAPLVDPCRRALSYQALMAYLHKKYSESSTQVIEEEEPADFSSEYEGKDETRKFLASMLNTGIREETQA
jgi:hypothetical protein